jgi:hypothetical protein
MKDYQKICRIATEDQGKGDRTTGKGNSALNAFSRLLNFYSLLCSRSMQNSRRKHDQRKKESKKSIHCYPDDSERKREDPNDGIEYQCQQSQRQA